MLCVREFMRLYRVYVMNTYVHIHTDYSLQNVETL